MTQTGGTGTGTAAAAAAFARRVCIHQAVSYGAPHDDDESYSIRHWTDVPPGEVCSVAASHFHRGVDLIIKRRKKIVNSMEFNNAHHRLRSYLEPGRAQEPESLL